MMSNTKC